MVAEQDSGVGPVPRITQGADAEQPIVDEVAEEDRAPLTGRVGFQRLEEPLEVAVNVAGDQDRQVARSHSSPSPTIRRTARVQDPIVCSSVRFEGQRISSPSSFSSSGLANGMAQLNSRLPAAPPKIQKESHSDLARARPPCAFPSQPPRAGSRAASA